MSLQIFNYQDNPIAFNFANGVRIINATEMARPFKKVAKDFLRLKQTKSFIEAYSRWEDRPNGTAKVPAFKVIQGGVPELQGTWMCEKLALKFAAWLSPEFEIWVFDRIQELLTTGLTQLPALEATSSLMNNDAVGALLAGLEGLKDKGSIEARLKHIEEQFEKFPVLSIHHRLSELEDQYDNLLLEIEDYYQDIFKYFEGRGIESSQYERKMLGCKAVELSKKYNFIVLKKESNSAEYEHINLYHIAILKEMAELHARNQAM